MLLNPPENDLNTYLANSKYLLYIDILGFSDLVRKDYEKVKQLYQILDSLHSHRQQYSFRTIVFSDTILIAEEGAMFIGDDSAGRLRWFNHFVTELTERTFELDIHFRAITTRGEFFYEKMKNIESYFGDALISCYNKEKEINAVGFFADKTLWFQNSSYTMSEFDSDVNFVFLLRGIEDLYKKTKGIFPVDASILQSCINEKELAFSCRLLSTYQKHSIEHPDPRVRIKFLHTYSFYRQRYLNLVTRLEYSNFDYNTVFPCVNWEKQAM